MKKNFYGSYRNVVLRTIGRADSAAHATTGLLASDILDVVVLAVVPAVLIGLALVGVTDAARTVLAVTAVLLCTMLEALVLAVTRHPLVHAVPVVMLCVSVLYALGA